MRRLLAVLLMASGACLGQTNAVGPQLAAYTLSGSSWIPQTSTLDSFAIDNAPAVELYCLNTATQKWVPWTSECGSGGGFVVPTGTGFIHITNGAVDPAADANVSPIADPHFTGDGSITGSFTANNFIGFLNSVSIGGTPVAGNVPVATDSTHAVWGNRAPTGTGFVTTSDGVQDPASRLLLPPDIPAVIGSDTTGNSGTTTALKIQPTVCQPVGGVTTFPTGIDTQGNATGCSIPTGSGQPGSVTTVTVDDIPDLANTTVTTPTTTPHVSFALLGAPAHSFFGNNSDVEGAGVGYSDILFDDLPSTVTGIQAHNTFFASPDATNGTPGYRDMVPNDIHGLPTSTTIFFGAVGEGTLAYVPNSANITLTAANSLDFITHGTTRQMQLDTLGNLNFGVNLGKFMDTNRNIFPNTITSTLGATIGGNLVLPTASIFVTQGNVQSEGGLVSPDGRVITGGLLTGNNVVTFTDASCTGTAVGTENVINVDGSAVTTARVCPMTLVNSPGVIYTVVKIDSNALLQVNVRDNSTGTVDGQPGYTLFQQYQAVTVQGDGTNWKVIAQYNPNISNDQFANTVLAGPNGTFGHVGYRTLVLADTPLAAPKASPAFTGIPTAPTAASNSNTTQIATTAMVQAAITTETPTTEIFGQIAIAVGQSEGNDSTHSNISISSVCVASPMNPISATPVNPTPWDFLINVSQGNISIVLPVANVMLQKQVYSYMCRP